jgi:hypothetical protein
MRRKMKNKKILLWITDITLLLAISTTTAKAILLK